MANLSSLSPVEHNSASVGYLRCPLQPKAINICISTGNAAPLIYLRHFGFHFGAIQPPFAPQRNPLVRVQAQSFACPNP